MMLAPRVEPLRRIVVVDDDQPLREQVRDYLEEHGYQVWAVPGGEGLDKVLSAEAVDLVILDIMLPGEDGLSICRRLAGTAGPGIILMSALVDEVDRVLGLELGADDYLAKPCSPRELLAHVRAFLRRVDEHRAGSPRPSRPYRFLGFQVDPARREVKGPDGAAILLTMGEFALLKVFLDHPQRILSREHLLELARGGDADVFDRAVDVQISRLRRKLHSATDHEVIRTLRGAGYMMDVRVARD